MSLFIFTSVDSFKAEFPKYEEKFINIYDNAVAKLDLSEAEKESVEKGENDGPNH